MKADRYCLICIGFSYAHPSTELTPPLSDTSNCLCIQWYKGNNFYKFQPIIILYFKDTFNPLWDRSVPCLRLKVEMIYHTEWSQSDWGRQVSYDVIYMWKLKKKKKRYKWTYLQNRNRITDIEQTYGFQGEKGRRNKLGNSDWHIVTTIYKIDD